MKAVLWEPTGALKDKKKVLALFLAKKQLIAEIERDNNIRSNPVKQSNKKKNKIVFENLESLSVKGSERSIMHTNGEDNLLKKTNKINRFLEQ